MTKEFDNRWHDFYAYGWCNTEEDRKEFFNFGKNLKNFIAKEIDRARAEERVKMILAITELFDEFEMKDVGFPDSNWQCYKFVRNHIRDWAKAKGIKDLEKLNENK